ncbi:hypothetical protein GN156_22010 [bacterium LRH843]|nr:hypothetical protein [bacterium LRH843]
MCVVSDGDVKSGLPKKQSLGHVRGPEIDQLRPENSDTRPEPARSLDIIIIIIIIIIIR